MATIILSGVGGSTNWLPLIFPLVIIAGILMLSDAVMKYIKKRRLLHENKLVNDVTTASENTTTSNEHVE